MSPPILVERDGAIATVVLNQPDKLNAMNKAMWAGLAQAMQRCRTTTPCAASSFAAPAGRPSARRRHR